MMNYVMNLYTIERYDTEASPAVARPHGKDAIFFRIKVGLGIH